MARGELVIVVETMDVGSHNRVLAEKTSRESCGHSGSVSVSGSRDAFAEENGKTKALLDRIVAILTKLGQRGYAVHEESAEYGTSGIDPDPDTDSDPDGTRRQRRRD